MYCQMHQDFLDKTASEDGEEEEEKKKAMELLMEMMVQAFWLVSFRRRTAYELSTYDLCRLGEDFSQHASYCAILANCVRILLLD